MKTPLLIIILLFTIQTFIQADVRYVSKTGSNTPPYLTWETASDSIQKCLDICDNGDTVYVGNGVYKESLIINKQIALIGSSMDSAVIDGRGLAFNTIEIDEFSNTYIENFTIHGIIPHDGRAISTLSLLNIKSCIIDGCGLGIGTIGVTCNMNNVIIKNAKHGFSGGCFSDTCNYFITNNVIVVDTESSDGINTLLGGNYTINNNIILFTGKRNPEHGISFGWVKRVYVENNIISNFIDNIFTDIIGDTLFVINNLLIYQAGGFTSASISSSGDRIVVKNTILTNNLRGIDGDWKVKSDYNIYWNNTFDLVGVSYGDSDIVADPMFVKDIKPDTSFSFDYHLQAFSPGIDKGDPSILDVDGTRSDIGSYGGPKGEKYIYLDLAPREPRGLAGSVDSSKISIRWSRNTEADLSHYKLYRDTIPNFTADSTTLIAIQPDTFHISVVPLQHKHYYYKLRAIDNQGNESGLSNEIAFVITDMNEVYQTIQDYKLYQNYPNPFNPETKIGWQLKERGNVKIIIYDIKGEMIQTLINSEMESGYYESNFNASSLASGIYLYRIEVTGGNKIPKYSEMRKMVLIK